jgi:pilus assembly protein Flp/PilA
VKKLFKKLKNDYGATAVEYGLLVSLIAAAIVTLVGVLGGKVGTAFQAIVNALPN